MLVVDRFEDGYAIIENGDEYFKIKKRQLPEAAKEGSILKVSDKGYEIDIEATEMRRKEILKLQDSLWE